MHRHTRILGLLLLAVLLAGCNWPLSHPEAEPLAAARTPSLQVEPSLGRDAGPATAFVSPLVTPAQVATLVAPMASTAVTIPGRNGLFSGQSVRFDLPAGYRVLEGIDGGCFLYREALPGFLVLYPASGEPAATLTGLLNATGGSRRTEPPLEVDLGGLPFVGLFVETDSGSRLFLAAAEGWALVAEAPLADWPVVAAGLNEVLTTLSFEEDF
jgi:hypothetical protein